MIEQSRRLLQDDVTSGEYKRTLDVLTQFIDIDLHTLHTFDDFLQTMESVGTSLRAAILAQGSVTPVTQERWINDDVKRTDTYYTYYLGRPAQSNRHGVAATVSESEIIMYVTDKTGETETPRYHMQLPWDVPLQKLPRGLASDTLVFARDLGNETSIEAEYNPLRVNDNSLHIIYFVDRLQAGVRGIAPILRPPATVPKIFHF